ncbi:AAA family ATPase [Citricoccus sp. CH26A]|nr:AAA family ATPase [Citricoccus sp. CH26A]
MAGSTSTNLHVSPKTARKSARGFRDDLELLLKARYPTLYIESFEETRVLEEIVSVASDTNRLRIARPVWQWTLTEGLISPDRAVQPNTQDPGRALDWILQHHPSRAVFVFHDLHALLGDGSGRSADASLVRRLRDIARDFQFGDEPRVLIIVAPVLRIPPELEKEWTIVDFPLPSQLEIRQVLDNMIKRNSDNDRLRVEVDDEGRERLSKAAMGLTLHEAENAFARAMVEDGVLSNSAVEVVLDEKRQAIRKSGLLEFVSSEVGLDDVGGLQNLKRWLAKRSDSWMAEAKDYCLPAPRGVLITGVPGCGKSLSAKAVAATWGLPLLRLDIGRVFAGLVGSSEHNMRSAIRAAEATAPCVLWIDEIEKGFSGVSGLSHDSGTSSRVFGSFLTWMQEKTLPVFVIATANSVDVLPPEFLRKGRFDEIFFVDLPTETERRQVWNVHLARRLENTKVAGDISVSEVLTDQLAEVTEGYSGAEIEQAVIAGLFDAFADRRSLTKSDLERAVRNMVPLSVTQAEQVSAIREWAARRAVAATTTEDRSGYVTAQQNEEMPLPPDGPISSQTDRALARGGRLVDF